ncbi:hypothetical protein ACFIQG_20295 [Comamonas odontotermitis]|uniref:PFGI-1 class ICE element type IV pilus protein PilL2 n=1 Tax=Comamonas odontotermitis TaxID=379895 RepID=UPI0036703984
MHASDQLHSGNYRAGVCPAHAGAGPAQVGDTYDGGAQVRIGQYSTQSTEPAPSVSDPLAVFVQLNFPRQGVASIEDAVRYTLMRTGWNLAPELLPPEAQAFLRLPVPESQRSLGTFRVRDVLQALTGPTWRWWQDPVHRRQWFTLAAAPSSASSGPATPAQPAPAPAVLAAPAAVPSAPEVVRPGVAAPAPIPLPITVTTPIPQQARPNGSARTTDATDEQWP